jgi:hypothetical protein
MVSRFILQESLEQHQLPGLALLVCGIALVLWKR